MFMSKRSRADGNELEIVYEVQWKTPGNDNDKAKIIGIIDSPDTNLDWNTFKSYLIQNSGNMHVSTDDIKLSYVDSDDDLIPVDSEMEFRECLKFSRIRARHGRKVMMKISMGSNGGAKPKEFIKNYDEHSSKSKLFRLKKKEISEKKEYPNQEHGITNNSEVPKWFENYMANFKTVLVKEITDSVVLNLKGSLSTFGHQPHTRRTIINDSIPKPHMHHMFEKRKKKKKISEEDSSDCTDGLHKEWEEKIDILRQMQKISKREKKFEKKLDAKLEKLETKTKKIMEKKSFLLFGDANKTGPDSKRSARFQPNPSAPAVDSIMDALPVEEYTYTPHVPKGEIVTQTWKVMNNGNLPWTDETELRFAWGSKSLVPVMASVKCPLLQPGEIGKVKVKLQAPMFGGNFESYWHFHHAGRRFGHWLGCSVIVDDEKQSESPMIQDHSNQQEVLAANTPVDLTMKCSKLDTPVMEENSKKTFVPVFEFNTLDNCATDTSLPVKQENELDQRDFPLSIKTNSIFQPLPFFQFEPSAGRNWNPQNQVTVPVGDLLNIKVSSEDLDKEKKIENVTQGIATMTIYGVPDEWKDSEIPVDLGETKNTEDKEEYCSDSDNISVISGTGSVDTDATEPSEEFVVIPMPQCFNCEQDFTENIPVTQPISVEIPKSSSEESVQLQESDNNNNMELKPYPEIPICIPVLMTPDEAATGDARQMPTIEVCQESEEHNEHEPEAVTDDEDPNNVYVRDSTGRAIPVAKVMSQQSQSTGNFSWNCSSHNTFGDPNIGHGPNGPRFPCGATYFYDSNVPQCHNPGASANFRPQHDCPKIPTAPMKPTFCGHPCKNGENATFKRSECHCPNFQHPVDYQNLKHEHNCTFYQRTTRESPQRSSPPKKTSQQTISQSSTSSSSSSWSHTQHNIHTEQPRPYKYAYVFEKEPKKQSSSTSTNSRRSTKSNESREQSPVAAAVQILPETLVTGAVNVASSAINTARTVIDMLIPRHDDVVTGHWEHVPPAVEESLRTLSEMGFNNRELNIMLLKRHDNDIARVISELIQ